MLEKDIVAAILRYLKHQPDCFCFKEHGGMYGTSGLPDIICCVGGKFVGLEVKTPDGKLSKLQEVALAKINAAGGLAMVVRSVDEAKAIIESVRRSSG
jgi:hypothetical protein